MTEILNISMSLIFAKLAITLSLTVFGYLAGKVKLVSEEGYFSITNLLILTVPLAMTVIGYRLLK